MILCESDCPLSNKSISQIPTTVTETLSLTFTRFILRYTLTSILTSLLLQGSDIRELRFNSERLLRRYTEFVDTIITLESLTSAVDLIDQVADRIINHPAWMPRRWLEST